jgi:hypothetical protein
MSIIKKNGKYVIVEKGKILGLSPSRGAAEAKLKHIKKPKRGRPKKK